MAEKSSEERDKEKEPEVEAVVNGTEELYKGTAQEIAAVIAHIFKAGGVVELKLRMGEPVKIKYLASRRHGGQTGDSLLSEDARKEDPGG